MTTRVVSRLRSEHDLAVRATPLERATDITGGHAIEPR
jgi:hypothetical protein